MRHGSCQPVGRLGSMAPCAVQVEVGVPPPSARRDILAKQLAGMAHDLTPEQVGGVRCRQVGRSAWQCRERAPG